MLPVNLLSRTELLCTLYFAIAKSELIDSVIECLTNEIEKFLVRASLEALCCVLKQDTLSSLLSTGFM